MGPQQAILNNKDRLQKSNVPYIRPERVNSFEVGYRGLLSSKLSIDANYYYGVYTNFILNTVVLRPNSPVLGSDGKPNSAAAQDILSGKVQAFQLYANAPDKVSAQGATLGLTYRTPGGYQIGTNGTWSSFDLRNADHNNVAAFNTPRFKTNVTLGHRTLAPNLGVNLGTGRKVSTGWDHSTRSFPDAYPLITSSMPRSITACHR